MAEIVHKLTIKSDKKKVFDTISTESGISKWWTSDCEIDDKNANFYFQDRKFSLLMEITDNSKDEKLVWKNVGGYEEWKGTQVEFHIEDHDDGTLLTFKHIGWESTDGNYGWCSLDWAKYLLWMRTYCEKGEIAPHLK